MNKKCIIFFGPSDWFNMNPSSGTHLAKKLSVDNWILYINPISSDLGGTLNSSGINKFLLLKILRKLKSFAKAYHKINNNLSIFTPIFIPYQGNKYLDKINNFLIWVQIRYIILIYSRYSSHFMWIENIRSVDFITYMKWDKIIYHVSDLFVEDEYSKNKDVLIERDSFASEKSDLIICVSIELYNSKKDKYKNVYYLPHGVDFEMFYKTNSLNQKHPILTNMTGPIIGYFGTLTKSNDIELLEKCALHLPDYNFVFAGEITGGNYTNLKNMKNVLFIGFIPYEEIALLCSSFDVCLLPWIMDSWIEHCNPLKLFEYMSCGKPIVSVPIKEIVYNYSDVVSVAYNHEDFYKAIEWELNNDNNERKMKRISIAENNSWTKHIETITQLTS